MKEALHTITILLVDDDPLVRESIAHIIEAQGLRVLTADGADGALKLLAGEQVDVLFTDIVMPEWDGIELAQRARALHPDLRVVFTTGYFSRAADARPFGKLVFKPVRAKDVKAVLEDVLGAG